MGERLSEEYEDYRAAFTLANSQGTNDSIAVNTSDDGTIFCSRTENDWYLMLMVRNRDLYRDGYRQLIVSFVALALMVAVFATILVISVKERFRAENALRMKEKFLSGLSDRFRALLHNIIELSASEVMSTEEMTPTAESIRLETGQLSNMMDNLFSYSNIIQSEDAQKTEKKTSKDFTIKTQHKYRFLIIVVFLVTMVTTILISGMLHLRWARVNMTEEANSYSHHVSSWVLEQQSILGMFVNEIATKPDMVNDYPEMVKWLDNISKHYPGISATYIANPAFDEIHSHPMIMNNGWIPADDYVEEERDWYINALNTPDYSITEPYYDARTGQYCLTFSKAVYTDSGEFVGVFAIDFYLNVLTDIIDSDFTTDGYAFLADKDGRIINHPNPAYQPWNDEFVNLSTLSYADVYNGDSGSIGTIIDYDGSLRECIECVTKRHYGIFFMALLHDVGKIGIPDNVINKPGKLTDEEFALIKKHPVIGFDILKDITEMPEIGQGARWHHERYGGGGYPDGIEGEDIPVYARIIGMADAYDAMTSKRSYRGMLSQDVVKNEIEKGIGTQFDPTFAKIMLEMITEDVNYKLHE